jgi:hypothetical protein
MKTIEEAKNSTEGRAVFYTVLWPSMRRAAIELGWNLGLHGSMESDMDIVNGKFYTHLVKAKDPQKGVQIGNNRGSINGWTKQVYGKVTSVL